MEEAARLALERADVATPVDPEAIVIDQGLRVYNSPTEGYLVGRKIFVDETLRRERRAFAIAHELGHWLLRDTRWRESEAAANYVASALLLPRVEFEHDLRQVGWDLIALCARHRWASFEAVARRIVALRDARACVFDYPVANQRPPSEYVVPWRGPGPTVEERDAAYAAISSGSPVDVRPGLTAWPILESDWNRAITMANA